MPIRYDWKMESNPIRLRRENLHLSLRELGNVSGIPFPTLNRIERNINGARVDLVKPIADALLVDDRWLYEALSLYYELLLYGHTKEEFFKFQDAVVDDLSAARAIVEAARTAPVTLPKRSE